jgi:spore coat polysaccharide biosynthesis protein SpsF
VTVVVIVQARMASTRLPGKAMADLAGKPVLEHVLDRVQTADIGQVIVATTTDPDDDVIAAEARRAGVYCYRGHPTDVLERFYVTHGMLAPDAGAIVRVTADCPLLDIGLLRQVAGKVSGGGYDYVGVKGVPDGYHQEAFTARALGLAHRLAVTACDREHVVTYMLDRPALFRVGWIEAEIQGEPVTLDTQADLDRLRDIAAA